MYLATHEKGKPFIDQLDNVLEVTGERTLPRMWPPVGFLEERSAYPMLVTFGDLADPTSVAEVDPDDLVLKPRRRTVLRQAQDERGELRDWAVSYNTTGRRPVLDTGLG